MNSLFNLYSYRMEMCENIAKDLANSLDPNDDRVQEGILGKYGVIIDDLTTEEAAYIVKRAEEMLSY